MPTSSSTPDENTGKGMAGLELADPAWTISLHTRPLMKAHKPLPRRRDFLNTLAYVASLPVKFESHLDEERLQDNDDLPTRQPQLSSPKLPITPPSGKDDLTPFDESEMALAGHTVVKRYSKNGIATPQTPKDLPTPEITPPRLNVAMRNHSNFSRTQPSMSSRAESFRTAREELSSEEEGATSWVSPRPPLGDWTSRLASTASLELSAVPCVEDTPKVSKLRHYISVTPSVSVNEGLEVSSLENREELKYSLSGSPIMDSKHKDDIMYDELPNDRHPMSAPGSSGSRTSPGMSPINGGQEKRLTTRRGTRIAGPAIGLPLGRNMLDEGQSLDDRVNSWRHSAISNTSTIEAIVLDTTDIAKPPRLRHTRKIPSLRSASSPVPQSNRTSWTSAASHDNHRLVRKTAKLTNGNRLSMNSDASKAFSNSSAPSSPQTSQPFETIHVVVIPQRRSSLKSSSASSRRHSLSASSGSGPPRFDSSASAAKISASPRRRTVSDAGHERVNGNTRGRDRYYPPSVPTRTSSLSAPTSRNNSRASSMTSETLRMRRIAAEEEVRRTLERMESEQSRQVEITPEPSKEPTVVVPPTDVATDLGFLLPPSAPYTPFSQNSVLTTSSQGAAEIEEATAITYYPHNNDSLQLIEPRMVQESNAVRQLQGETDRSATPPQPVVPDIVMGSPLKNPREPPIPPAFKIIPPTPAGMTPNEELDRQLGNTSENKSVLSRGLGSVRRALSVRRQSDASKPSFVRTLSTTKARNTKKEDDLDDKLHPFWRPRRFWDDYSGSDSESEPNDDDTVIKSLTTAPSVTSAPAAGSGSGGGSNHPGFGSPTSPTNPTLPRPATSDGRKRDASLAGLDSSPGSIDSREVDNLEDQQTQDDKKRQPVKRACNECRQQKLKCDVVQDPFTTCSRCRRLNLECKIENNFKRIGKRSRNAEMEREIVSLRRQLAEQQARLSQADSQLQSNGVQRSANAYGQTLSQAQLDQWGTSHEAVASLLDLRSGLDGSNGFSRTPSGQASPSKKIEDVRVAQDKVGELFNLFFTFYHPFLPFLSQDKSPEAYYTMSPLLFWTIISVGARRYSVDPSLLTSLSGPVNRLVWSTLADVPQSYHVVKALCLLCTWPFPTSSTSTDPTFIFCGMMMQVAIQIGLHRPSHAQDFSKFRIELREEELKDRVTTWAVCNIVAQRVSTGYGQPSSTDFDYTLTASAAAADPNFALPTTIQNPLLIEQFADKVTNALYSNRNDPLGLCKDGERVHLVKFLVREFDELEDKLSGIVSPITNIYLRAAAMHLRLSVFFSSSSLPSYHEDLLALYMATTAFLEACLNLDQQPTATSLAADGTLNMDSISLLYSTNYIYQMMLAAGFVLFKLKNSHSARRVIDLEYTKEIFLKTIWAIRNISAAPNDLPQRLAEVLAQLWKHGGVSPAAQDEEYSASTRTGTQAQGNVADSDEDLQLKVKCRNSMSLVYDAVWRWREDFMKRGNSFDTFLKNPTDPATAAESSASSMSTGSGNGVVDTALTGSLAPSMVAGMAGMPTGMGNFPVGVGGMGYGDVNANYEVFDPLNWMLDGLVDFPYSSIAMQGLDPSAAGAGTGLG